jgi:hypothetical protein
MADYSAQVQPEADAEHERVRTKYAPARPRDLVVFGLAIGFLCVASIYHEIEWAFTLGIIVALAAWEFTKFRLRRNARDYARRGVVS